MNADKILVIVSGVAGIVFVYWFFLSKKREPVAVSGSVDVKVEGGYQPEVISVPLGKRTVINFTRTDPTSCLEEVVLGDFNVRRELPLNKKISVEILPKKTGEFIYSCGMNMYHGRIIVK